jgi:carboxypeptidase family protein/TonB-dependent receptor-like protein
MTKSTVAGVLVVFTILLALPVLGYAQEATLSGTVADSTGGVLPGVTVTAVHVTTGNVFEVVTDETGTYRLTVRVGTYRLTAQLAGFQTVIRTDLALLLGQQLGVDLQLAPASVSESVTVTGAAALVDTTSSTIGANIDPRQMQDLPINGRNWMDLTLLAPGARRNEGGGMAQFRQGYSQTNVDGQQLTINYHSQTDTEQPGFNRDAIAEFEVIANRFDATQGRSSGMIVNAVTKSGTNNFAGSFGGYFRHDKFNAEDFIERRVLPYSNQQISLTFGGPIRRDRVHFFGSYGYGREPKTYTYNSPYPSFNIDQEFPTQAHTALGRLDYQFTPQTRLATRVSYFNNVFYAGGGATSHPSAGGTRKRVTPQYAATLTQVLGSRAVNEIRAGGTNYERQDAPSVRWKGGDFPYRPVLRGAAPIIQVQGYTIGANSLNIFQHTQTVRDDYTTSYDWSGRHDVKLGGEYLRFQNDFRWCNRCMGEIDARLGPPPANLQSLFPVWDDASTWNLAPLSPLTSQVFHALSDTEHRYNIVRHILAGWVQDDWRVGNSLTLNLGVRYDWDSNGHSEKLQFLPFLPGNLPHDNNNVAPRVGMNLRLTDRTVLRGGYGLFFAFAPNDGVQQSYSMVHRFEYQIANNGRPDFVPNWFGPGPSGEGEFGGPKPTWEASLARACDINNNAPGCVRRAIAQEINYPGRRTSYSHQASAGLQHQMGDTMSVEANYVFTAGRLEETVHNANLSYNPATGANYPFADITRRPFPQWGVVLLEYLEGQSNYQGTDLTFTKRFSDRWQATATYTLGFFKDRVPARPQWYLGPDGVMAQREVGFPLAPDLGGDYGYAGAYFAGGAGAAGDQRHRAVLNGLWDVGLGVQVSGIYFYGSGERFATNTGVDRRGEGNNAASELRLRANGTIIPRAAIVGEPIHRMDMRVQKRLSLGARMTVDGLFEVYNLFNHTNFGSYTTNESNANYGKPSFNGNVAYQPRMMQVGFRLGF